MKTFQPLFDLSSSIRYVAFSSEGRVWTEHRSDLNNSSDGESDKYEELFVNPAILLLARNRGDIDCGGLQFVVVRYGNFYQFIQPFGEGHISIAIEPDTELDEIIPNLKTAIEKLAPPKLANPQT